MTSTIHAAKAAAIVTDRVVSDIDRDYSARLDDYFDRGADDVTSDGIYLPDPDNIYRRSRPGTETDHNNGTVNIYVGQYQPEQVDDQFSGAVEGGSINDMVNPWRVGVSMLPAAGVDVPDPVLGGQMERVAAMQRRVQYYVGGLKAALSYWAGVADYGDDRDHAFRKFSLIDAFSGTTLLDNVAEGDNPLRVRGFVDFEVFNRQLFPEDYQ